MEQPAHSADMPQASPLSEEPLGFYFAETVPPSTVFGATCLYGVDGPGRRPEFLDRPHHILYGTPSSIITVPVIYRTQGNNVLEVNLDHTRARSTPILDGIRWLWPYQPRPTWIDDVEQVDENGFAQIKVAKNVLDVGQEHNLVMKDLKKTADNRWLSFENIFSVVEGCLVLTERLELLLFGVNVVSTKLRLMAKLSLRDQNSLYRTLHVHTYGPIRNLLSVDSQSQLILMAFFPHRLEFLSVNPRYPFALGFCFPHRSAETRPIFLSLVPLPKKPSSAYGDQPHQEILAGRSQKKSKGQESSDKPNGTFIIQNTEILEDKDNDAEDEDLDCFGAFKPTPASSLKRRALAAETTGKRRTLKAKNGGGGKTVVAASLTGKIAPVTARKLSRSNRSKETRVCENTALTDAVSSCACKPFGEYALLIISTMTESPGCETTGIWSVNFLRFEGQRHPNDIGLMEKLCSTTVEIPNCTRPGVLLDFGECGHLERILLLGQSRLKAIDLREKFASPSRTSSSFELPVEFAEVEGVCAVQVQNGTGWLVIDEDENLRFVQKNGAHNFRIEGLGAASVPTVILFLCANGSQVSFWIGSEFSASQSLTVDFNPALEDNERVIRRVTQDSLAPILDFVDLSATVDLPPVVVGGWGSNGGIRIVRPGISARQLIQFPNCQPFSRIFPLTQKQRDGSSRLIALLCQPKGPSFFLAMEAGGGSGTSLNLSIKAEVQTGLIVDVPTIRLIESGSFYIQVTSAGVAVLRENLNEDPVFRWRCGEDHFVVDGAKAGEGTEELKVVCLIRSLQTFRDSLVLLPGTDCSEVQPQELEPQVHPLAFNGSKLASFGSVLVVASMDCPVVHLMDSRFYQHCQTVHLLASASAVDSMSLKCPRNSYDSSGFSGSSIPVDVEFLTPSKQFAAVDLKTYVIVVLTSNGELVIIDLLHADDAAELPSAARISARRRINVQGGSLIKLSNNTLLAVGSQCALISRDFGTSHGNCCVIHANLPPRLSALTQVDFGRPDLFRSFSSTEVPMLMSTFELKQAATLSLALVDLDWKTKRQTSTVTGFCIEHVEYHQTSKCFVAAGMEGKPVKSLNQISNVKDLISENRQAANRSPCCGVLLLLTPEPGKRSLLIVSRHEVGPEDLPTALSVRRIHGEELVLLGTTSEVDEGKIRVLRIVSERPYCDDLSSTQVHRVECLITLGVEGPVNSLSSMHDYVVAGITNSLKFYMIQEPKQPSNSMQDCLAHEAAAPDLHEALHLEELCNYVMYNSIENIQPMDSLLLVADCQRSCGILEVQKVADGITLTERAHDAHCVSVLSAACVDETTFVLSDDNKNLWILRRSSDTHSGGKWDTLTRFACFRANQQINKLRRTLFRPNKLKASRGDFPAKTRMFSLLEGFTGKAGGVGKHPRVSEDNVIPSVQWVSREGGIGHLVPIYSASVIQNLGILVSSINQCLSFIGDACPERSRSCIEQNLEVPAKNVIDGFLLESLLSRPLKEQKKVFARFMELQIQKQRNDQVQGLEFSSFIAEIESLVSSF